MNTQEIDASTAVARLSAAMEPLRDRERCALAAASDRILAEDLVAALR